jgi:PAS domain-containing protein
VNEMSKHKNIPDTPNKVATGDAGVESILDAVSSDFDKATGIMADLLQHASRSLNDRRNPIVVEVPNALSDLNITITRLQQVVELTADLFRSSLALFQYHPDAILVVSGKGFILMCNRKAEELFNRNSSDLQGHRVSNFVVQNNALQLDGTSTEITISTATVTLPDGLFTIMSFREV